jgi:peroxiredoxin Q/BCP
VVEGKGLRDNFEKLTEAGVKIFGVSLQDGESHEKFINKYGFQFPLVVDDETIAMAFNVPYKGEFTKRQSFLIGEDGKLLAVWRKVSPAGHAEEVLAAATA